MTTALVFAAGGAPPELSDELSTLTLGSVICADGGLAHCLAAGLVPDCLVGDFDSTDPQLLERVELDSVQLLQHRPDKNESDLELCLDHLARQHPAPDDVLLLGISGGRSDHHLFNWLLPMARDWPFGVRLIDDSVNACLVTPDRPLDVDHLPGEIFSLLPLGDALGVLTGGLEYALNDAELSAGTTRGLSNVTSGGRVHVSLAQGRLLAMHVRR